MPQTASTTGVRGDHVVVPHTGCGPARLSFDNGVERLEIRADGTLDQLWEARFSDPYPVVWSTDHNIHVEYPLGARLLRRRGPNLIRLHPAVPWSLDVHGGAAHLDADLAAVAVESVNCHAAVADTRIVLGRPAGTRTIRLAAVRRLRIERPAGVPVRLDLAKGAAKLSLDDRYLGAVGRGHTIESTGYQDATDRYHVTVAGGADTVTVARIP